MGRARVSVEGEPPSIATPRKTRHTVNLVKFARGQSYSPPSKVTKWRKWKDSVAYCGGDRIRAIEAAVLQGQIARIDFVSPCD